METIENSQAISVSQTVRVVSYQMAVKWEIRQFWPPSWVFQNGGKGVIWHIIFRYFSVPSPMVKSRRKYLQPLPRYWGILGQDGWKPPTLRGHSMETIEDRQAISVSETVRVVSYQMAMKSEIRQFWPPSWIRKRLEIGPRLLLMLNRKSYVIF